MMHEPLSRDIRVATGDSTETRRVTLRELVSDDDYARSEVLQQATWGEGFAELVTGPMMMITQKVGGLAAGAFDEHGELLACIYGITGLRGGRAAHWSHIMAVREGDRSSGIGRHLKIFQREFLLALGVEFAYWSFDPLVSRNAHLNLNRLGAEPAEYARDLYGSGDQNELHRGIGTDRFIVEWRLRDPRVEDAIGGSSTAPTHWNDAPIVNSDAAGQPSSDDFELPDEDVLRVEIPADIQPIKDHDPGTAVRWRRCTRRAFESALGSGYRILGLTRRDGRSFYALER